MSAGELAVLEALCRLLGCTADEVKDLGNGKFLVHGRPFLLVGPGTPAGLPAVQALTLVGERDGFRVYTLQ